MSVRSYIRRWRRERFWDDHHTPLENTGEEMIETFRDGMDR